MEIKILGPGCPRCTKLEELTRAAIGEMGIEADITHVTDLGEILQYPLISTPGLVINEKLVASGRIPSKAEITSLVETALGQEAGQIASDFRCKASE